MLSPESDRPIGLVEASKHLGVDLFEFARILAVERRYLEGGRVSALELERFRVDHRIERWWSEDAPQEWGTAEACVRAVLAALLERGCIAPRSTRRDNLWRGLPEERREIVIEVIEVLLDEGLLLADSRQDISVATTSVGAVQMIASGTISPPSLVEIWGS